MQGTFEMVDRLDDGNNITDELRVKCEVIEKFAGLNQVAIHIQSHIPPQVGWHFLLVGG